MHDFKVEKDMFKITFHYVIISFVMHILLNFFFFSNHSGQLIYHNALMIHDITCPWDTFASL